MAGDFNKLKQTIADGIKYLLLLRLRYAPSAANTDDLVALVRVWTNTFYPLRVWDDDNVKALSHAFRTVAIKTKVWPTPLDVYELTPKKYKRLPRLPEPELSDAEKAEIATIQEEIDILMRDTLAKPNLERKIGIKQ